MNGWQLFATALLVGFSGALMPGPLLTVDIKESMRRGPWVGPHLILGHAMLELALIAAILLGFGSLLGLGGVKGVIGLIGGVVLLFLAYGMISEARSKLELAASKDAEKPGMPPVLAGAVVSLSNPYWSIWWATIGLSYLTRARELGAAGIGLFFLGHITADFSWYSVISFTMARGRKVFSDRIYRAIVFVCGLFLIYVGLWFIDSAFSFLGFVSPSEWIRSVL